MMVFLRHMGSGVCESEVGVGVGLTIKPMMTVFDARDR
jgi:hypothetical protein